MVKKYKESTKKYVFPLKKWDPQMVSNYEEEIVSWGVLFSTAPIL